VEPQEEIGLSSVGDVTFEQAWSRASAMLARAERYRVPGESAGVELGVIDWGGEGELVLFHHANGFCAATLAPIAHRLADGHRVVSIDARGHGDSTPVAPGGDPDPYAWETLAADALAALRGVCARTGHERVSLAIGHSFGGALLLRAAQLVPDVIERLLLCDPVLHRAAPAEETAGRDQGLALREATLRRRDRFPSFAAAYDHCRTRGLFAGFTPEALALYVREGMRVDGDEVTLKCAREVEAAIFGGGGTSRAFEAPEGVTADTLFVHAQRGNFLAETYEALAARMPRARVASEDLGHLFPLETPDAALAFAEGLLAND